jgi:hypothetical protein
MKITILSGMCAIAIGGPALADFVVPDGSNYPWVRGSTDDSAYAEWDVFSTGSGPNAPDVGSFVGGSFAPGAPNWDAYDSSGFGFVTSSGNIYSFSGAINMHVVIPGFDYGDSHDTTVLLQIRTQGTEFDPDSVLLEGAAPDEVTELYREDTGMGFLVETLFRWEVPGSVLSYEAVFDAEGPDMSLDRIAVDMFAAGDDCRADFNGDGVVNSQDFVAFLNAFSTSDPSADFNGDGVVNSQDFVAFLNAFVTGC